MKTKRMTCINASGTYLNRNQTYIVEIVKVKKPNTSPVEYVERAKVRTSWRYIIVSLSRFK